MCSSLSFGYSSSWVEVVERPHSGRSASRLEISKTHFIASIRYKTRCLPHREFLWPIAVLGIYSRPIVVMEYGEQFNDKMGVTHFLQVQERSSGCAQIWARSQGVDFHWSGPKAYSTPVLPLIAQAANQGLLPLGFTMNGLP